MWLGNATDTGEEDMGLFDKVKESAQSLMDQGGDAVSGAVDKVKDAASGATGGKADDQINSGMETAKEKIGMQPGSPDPDDAASDVQDKVEELPSEG
jgi:hypothetical protein